MVEIKQFNEEYAEDAAKLFVDNFRKLRKVYKVLPVKYEDVKLGATKLNETVKKNPAVVAVSARKVVGYLTGFSNIQRFKGSSTGVFIPEWGHGFIFVRRWPD